MSAPRRVCRVLVLGGTAEARRVAGELAADPGVEVTTSLAGRVARPRLPEGAVRIGGFGGAAGLARWLREHRVDALIDATHPFAGTMSFNAARASAAAGVPLVALRRPGWTRVPGDRWIPAESTADAAALLAASEPRTIPADGRVFLTTGRTGLAAFAGLTAPWFLVRCVDPPPGPCPPRMRLLLDRGPFTVDGESELMRRHRIDAVVTKDSGGAATSAKLVAARDLGLPVIVVRRPPAPEGVPVVADPAGAVSWLATLRGQSG
ncbi:cobalt-precorrin-6A reductase [Nocardiopsis mangrovi]|uniref:Cobalt-precorrin-6A reductase n=1 Tax=Nocardiopsis mangrovi TaxID=1179818 RepID=A0ABV9DZX4_9ACTN